MPKYIVYMEEVRKYQIEVEADSMADAREQAYVLPTAELQAWFYDSDVDVTEVELTEGEDN